MKKFYQIIASVALSALAIGATAQLAAPHQAGFGKAVHTARVSFNNQAARTQSGYQNVLLDYVNGDEANNLPTLTFFYWLPSMYMNMRYTLADTNYNVRNNFAQANSYTPQYVAVAFDTMWDAYTQTFYSPITGATNPTTVDTIWGDFSYRNTSGKNDTCVFEVVAVDAGGFPTNTVYGRDTVIFNNGSPLAQNSVDSFQAVGFIVPAGQIVIPPSARHTWNFAIKMKVYGSKLDTLGLFYFSPGFNCTNGGITNAYTVMGVVDGRAPAVNSFVIGNEWYNDVKNGGNGAIETWPMVPPSPYAGTCAISAGPHYYDQVYAGCGTDTAYFPVQDLGLSASISFTDVTGMQELSTNGFNVSQNAPNPFNQNTFIAYNLAKASDVQFTVYDMTGRELVNNNYSTVAPGKHSIELSANQFTPGVYFYSVNVNGVKVTKRMVITQ